MFDMASTLSKIAGYALHEELITYPKPGLVSHIDSGSHKDMNYDTFILSINSLSEYFYVIALAGSVNLDFLWLKKLGIRAEQYMLQATSNINTHRGIIFILGIVVAATAYCLYNNFSYEYISPSISQLYGMQLKNHKVNKNSHGEKVRQKYVFPSIIDAAIAGFPLIFTMVEKFKQLQIKHTYAESKLIIFFLIMQELDDTNLVHRGGIEGLKFAKLESKKILANAARQNILLSAQELHKKFIRQNLSPGGCADVLAVIIFLDKIGEIYY